jgi:geranylgeranyl diphosphate synthase, type I
MDKLKQKKQEIVKFIQKLPKTKVTWSEDTYKKIEDFSSMGKMIRGSLFLRLYELLNGEKDMTKVAAALEITQSGILAHDDVMDKDNFRRGLKTIHNQYKDNINNEHYGYSMAICFGDIAFFESFKHIPTKAVKIYSNEMINCAFGQMQDVHYTYLDSEITKKQILEVYRLKTARYTFSLPMMLAAKLTNQKVKLFEKLGEHLGIIFQIIDDDIGIFGSKEEIGKTPGSDIKENKKTIHRLLLLKKYPALKKYYGTEVSSSELELIRQKTNEIKPEINEIINYHQTKVDELITKIPESAKEFLQNLANYNVSRKK